MLSQSAMRHVTGLLRHRRVSPQESRQPNGKVRRVPQAQLALQQQKGMLSWIVPPRSLSQVKDNLSDYVGVVVIQMHIVETILSRLAWTRIHS